MTAQPGDSAGAASPACEAELDARGLTCPEPVMMLHNRVRDMRPGEELLLRATDPSTRRDVARFCEFLGHALLSSSERGGEFLFRIRKKDAP